MQSMMMTLGMFVFSLPTLAYQDFSRQTSYRHASQSRIGVRPGSQYLGPGDDKITLSGWFSPELSHGLISMDTLRLMANQGEAWPLIEGTGRIYGLWVIEDLEEKKTIFFPDGMPRRIEFTLQLKRVDDNRVDLLGSLLGIGLSLLR